jgi:hypothetical protein
MRPIKAIMGGKSRTGRLTFARFGQHLLVTASSLASASAAAKAVEPKPDAATVQAGIDPRVALGGDGPPSRWRPVIMRTD